VKKDRLKEYFGTQRPSFAGGPGAGSNFYSGRDLGTHTKGSLGTRGADSNFSRRMQALVPNDNYDLLEEEEDELIDEDFVVENSIYSLEKTLEMVREWVEGPDGVLDPEEGDIEEISSDLVSLTKTEESLKDLALDVVLDSRGTGSLMQTIFSGAKNKTPGVGEIVSLYAFFKAYLKVSKNADMLRKISDELDKVLEKTPIGEMVAQKQKFIQRFTSGIKEVEKLQSSTYEAIGEMVEHVIKIIPTEYLAAGGGGVATAPAGPGAAAGATAGYVIGKQLEGMTASGIGELIEEFVQTFIESQEVSDSKSFTEWLTKNNNPNSLGLRILIFITDMFTFPGSRMLEWVPGIGNIITINRVLEGLLKGAKVQNILVKKITQLKNPELVFDDADLEMSDNSELPDGSSSLSNAGTFLRKLFVSKPGDTALFAESLNNRSLAYLIEEKDSVLDEDLEEEIAEIEEFSGAGAVAIGALPLGRSTKGPGRQHSSNSGGNSFPYSRKNRKVFNRYSKKTFGGSDE